MNFIVRPMQMLPPLRPHSPALELSKLNWIEIVTKLWNIPRRQSFGSTNIGMVADGGGSIEKPAPISIYCNIKDRAVEDSVK